MSGCADLALLGDVLEHVPAWTELVREAARVLRPGGHLFASTLNRTASARLLAVGVAEGLGLVPRGTHDPRLFVKPKELCRAARDQGLELVRLEGERPALAATLRSWTLVPRRSASLALSYCALFRKEEA